MRYRLGQIQLPKSVPLELPKPLLADKLIVSDKPKNLAPPQPAPVAPVAVDAPVAPVIPAVPVPIPPATTKE